MSNNIHKTAIIEEGAQIHESVKIGPFAIIGSNVSIGKDSEVGAYTVIDGKTTIGENNRIFQSVSIGVVPQDLKFHGENTETIIGNNNTIREFATIHRGTEASGKTVLGNNNLLMVYSHVAHDCVIGNNCILANSGTLAGHVEIGNFVIIGGLSAVHQFCKLGDHVILGGGSIVVQDVIPFALADGSKAKLHGINLIGLKRRGFTTEEIYAIKDAHKILFRAKLRLQDAIKELEMKYANEVNVQNILSFIKRSERGVCR